MVLPNYVISELLRGAWTVVGIGGLFITWPCYQDCKADLAAVQASDDYLPGGGREIVARQNIRNMRDRLHFMILFVIVGAIALSTPPRPNTSPTFYSWALSAGFIAIEWRLATAAFLDQRDRRALKTRARREHATDGTRRTDPLVSPASPSGPPAAKISERLDGEPWTRRGDIPSDPAIP